MIYDPALLDAIEGLPVADWRGRVWRHMFNDYTPDRVNTSGARWNPPGVGAIYTALQRRTAVESTRVVYDGPGERVLYKVEVSVFELVDLTGSGALAAVCLTIDDVHADDLKACQRVGGAVAWLERGGLLVPSARDPDSNLVILVGRLGLDDDLVVVEREVVEDRGTA